MCYYHLSFGKEIYLNSRKIKPSLCAHKRNNDIMIFIYYTDIQNKDVARHSGNMPVIPGRRISSSMLAWVTLQDPASTTTTKNNPS
jgi:hypothetical protein